MFPKPLSRVLLNVVLIFVTIFQPVAAMLAPETPPPAAAASLPPELPAEAAPSPLAEVAQRDARAQAARVEPAPVVVGTPLSPGTVKVTSSSPAQATALTMTGPHMVYFPSARSKTFAFRRTALARRWGK